MNPFEEFQNQASQAGAQAAQGAIQQAQLSLPGFAQQAQQAIAAQVPALQEAAFPVIHEAGREAGHGAREGLSSLSTGELALLGVGGVALLSFLGYAAYTSGQKSGTKAMNALREADYPIVEAWTAPDYDPRAEIVLLLAETGGHTTVEDVQFQLGDVAVELLTRAPLNEYVYVKRRVEYGDDGPETYNEVHLSQKGRDLARAMDVKL